jgi:hypothetical protein
MSRQSLVIVIEVLRQRNDWLDYVIFGLTGSGLRTNICIFDGISPFKVFVFYLIVLSVFRVYRLTEIVGLYDIYSLGNLKQRFQAEIIAVSPAMI